MLLLVVGRGKNGTVEVLDVVVRDFFVLLGGRAEVLLAGSVWSGGVVRQALSLVRGSRWWYHR